MFRRLLSRRSLNRRPQLFRNGRALRYESMEGRMMLTASGFANECAPELDDAMLDQIVPATTQSPQVEIAFEFDAADIVSDGGENATDPADIQFTLDPDVESQFRNTGATPIGAELMDLGSGRWGFSWTPTLQQQGTYRLFLIATDDAGGTGVPLSDVYAFELTINNMPSVDLNGGDGGNQSGAGFDYGPVTFTEGEAPVNIADTDASIPFVTDDMVASMTIELTNPQADDVLAVDLPAGSPLEIDATSTSDRLVIDVAAGGLADKADFEAALRLVTFANTSDEPGSEQRVIEVSINDGTSDSAASIATVDTVGTNDRPDLLQIDSPANAAVGTQYVLNLEATDPDAGDMLVFQIQSGPDGASFESNGSGPVTLIQVARDEADDLFKAQIFWTPSAADEDNSPVEFLVSVTDSAGSPDAEVYSITVDNSDPIANDDPSDSNDLLPVPEDSEGATRGVGLLLANDSDPDGDTITVNSVIVDGDTTAIDDSDNEFGNIGTFFTTAKGGRVLLATNGTLRYDTQNMFDFLAEGEMDTDSFQYTIIDDAGNVSAPATATITILGANDPPELAGDAPVFRVDEGAASTPLSNFFDFVTDPDDGDMVSFFGASVPEISPGSLSLSEGVLSFDQMPGEFDLMPGEESDPIMFSVTVVDTEGAMTDIPATVIVVGVNDAPIAVADPDDPADYRTGENTTLNATVSVLDNDIDDADPPALQVNEFSYFSDDLDADGVAPGETQTFGNGGSLQVFADGTFNYTPGDSFDFLGEGETGDDAFWYNATDGNSVSNVVRVGIELIGENDAPVANDQAIAAFENGQPVMENFAGSDVDQDTDPGDLTYVITNDLEATGEGTVTNNNDGTFTYDPGDDFQELAEGETTQISFDYSAMDQALTSMEDGTVTITVTGVNDAPVIDLSNETGVASALPTGSFDEPSSTINLQLDLSSSESSINSINLDLTAFASDPDGDPIAYAIDLDEGSDFRAANVPTLTNGVLNWSPTAADVASGYIIRITGLDMPPNGINAKPLNSFDIAVDVVAADPPEIVSVTEQINVALPTSVVVVQFDESLPAINPSNFTVTVVDGGMMGQNITVNSATLSANADEVTLELDQAAIEAAFTDSDSATQLQLTVSTGITDSDGNALEGATEFTIDLIFAV